MPSKPFPTLAAVAFAATLFSFFLKRRSSEINGGQVNNDAATNDGSALAASCTHTSTEGHGMATSSGSDYAAANDGTAIADSCAHTSTEGHGTVTSSGSDYATANDGTAIAPSCALTSTEGHGMATSSGSDYAAANDGIAIAASCAHTSTKGHGVAISSGLEYEVFLNFRGPDTRRGFADFLYTFMIKMGIRIYRRDDEYIPKGEEFGPELLQAINQSKISIPIFSRDYASSVWCLKELVQMVECQRTRGQKIMPIFYDVTPQEVRHQHGAYGVAFLRHENKKRYDTETIRKWKLALREASNLNGWDLHNMPNRREGQLAKKIAEKVFDDLIKGYLVVPDYLVSVDHQVDEILKEIDAGETSETTRIIGIHGRDGIGKTTIAKIIYNMLLNNFEDCGFLCNIREMSKLKGIEFLQNQLLSDILKKTWSNIRNIDEGIQTIRDILSKRRVLLLLDDVYEKNHMDAFVGKRDWFGKGSRLIITSRKEDVLNVPEVDYKYEVKGMDHDQSLQLFSRHAFKRDYPFNEYVNLSKKAIDIAGGLPSALEVIGRRLSRTRKEMWDVTLKKLENAPENFSNSSSLQ